MALDLALVACGIALLAFAGDKLVDFAAALAERAGLSAAVIGLTVVAAGTSAPEFVVSVSAALRGSADMALGNVLGSNIANITLVLGLTALIAPVAVHSQLLRLDYPVALLASWLTLLLCRDLLFGRPEGGFFLASLVAFMGYSILAARRVLTAPEKKEAASLVPAEAGPLSRSPLWVLAGGLAASMAALSGGAEVLIRGASGIALALGVTERVVGLTVVALGTSLPELVASIAAARRGQQEMAIANVVGSNIFNLLGILGTAALIRPVHVAPAAAAVDCWVMVASIAVLAPLFYGARRVSRPAAAVMVAAYLAYTASLVV